MTAHQIAPYSGEWPLRFARERDRLQQALGDLAIRIDHHGSTAVPGLAAKPIIDIQISVPTLRPLHVFVAALAPLGYVHVPHADDVRCPFLHRPAEWPHTHHLHLVEAGGEEEARTLAFRDYLRAHPAVALEYEQLKRRLAVESDSTTFEGREAYANAKTDFVEGVMREAVGSSSPNPPEGLIRPLTP
jgi:GrpB-like predicted nucleotidyltransferase (UPF0157 family)